MKSATPKVLHEVGGRPMLEYVLRAAYAAGAEKAVVVVGHGKEQVTAAFDGDRRIVWAEQTEQLGTGHAVQMADSELAKLSGDVLIVTGDAPLVRGQILQTLLNAHRDQHADASMATAILDDPTGYGRVIRDDAGEFVEIVEQIDCTPEQAAITEAFPSYYCLKVDALRWALKQLTNTNRKREFYLTDIFAHLRKAGKKIAAVQAVAADDILGVNTREQLAQIDSILQARLHREHREAGVTIVNSDQTYIEDGAAVGVDTIVQPFSFIGKDARVGANCVIGPFAVVPRGTIVRDGSAVAGNVSQESFATLS